MSKDQNQMNNSNYYKLDSNTAQVNRDTEKLAQEVSKMEINSPTEIGNNKQNLSTNNCASGKSQNDMNQQKNNLPNNNVNNKNENTNQQNTLNPNGDKMDIEEDEKQKTINFEWK